MGYEDAKASAPAQRNHIEDVTDRDKDAKNIQQQLAGISEHIYRIEDGMREVADRWWGSVPEKPSGEARAVGNPAGSGLGNINDELAVIRDRMVRLEQTTSRFHNLA